jgi:hypothetical protein
MARQERDGIKNSIRTKADVLQLIRENQEKLRSLGVQRIGLFGSFVRGEQRPDSDVDFLVDFDPLQKTFDHFMELSFFLEEALHRRIELVTPESLSPHLKPHILAEVEYASFGS